MSDVKQIKQHGPKQIKKVSWMLRALMLGLNTFESFNNQHLRVKYAVGLNCIQIMPSFGQLMVGKWILDKMLVDYGNAQRVCQ